MSNPYDEEIAADIRLKTTQIKPLPRPVPQYRVSIVPKVLFETDAEGRILSFRLIVTQV